MTPATAEDNPVSQDRKIGNISELFLELISIYFATPVLLIRQNVRLLEFRVIGYKIPKDS